jgi:hypothetical protein
LNELRLVKSLVLRPLPILQLVLLRTDHIPTSHRGTKGASP